MLKTTAYSPLERLVRKNITIIRRNLLSLVDVGWGRKHIVLSVIKAADAFIRVANHDASPLVLRSCSYVELNE